MSYRDFGKKTWRLGLAAMASAMALTVGAGLAGAQEVKMYKTAPSVEELEKALKGGDASAPKPKPKTRAIVFGDDEPAAAPAATAVAPAPSTYSAPAPAPSTYASPAPASAPAAAPARAYRPPAGAAPAVAGSGKAVGFPINFDTGSATIRPDSVAFLESIGGLLQKDAAMHMVIEGHTDARGNYQSNMELSRARANSVASYLAGRYGVETSRLQVVGKGPMEPLVPADPYAADNRRVQFRIVN